MLYSRQWDQETRNAERRESDATVKYEEEKIGIERLVAKAKAEMNSMFKEKSSIKSRIVN